MKKLFKDFKFGRNLLSVLLVLGGLIICCVVALCVYMPVKAVVKYNSTLRVPYVSKNDYDSTATTDETYESTYNNDTSLKGGVSKLEQINASEFDAFNISFTSVTYVAESLKFTIKIEKNDKTEELITNNKMTVDKINLCITSNYSGFIDYASTKTSLKYNTSDSAHTYTYTITGRSFPIKVSDFPIFRTIEKPDLYVYAQYSYDAGTGKYITKCYSIKYTPTEYYDSFYSDSTNFYWRTV